MELDGDTLMVINDAIVSKLVGRTSTGLLVDEILHRSLTFSYCSQIIVGFEKATQPKGRSFHKVHHGN